MGVYAIGLIGHVGGGKTSLGDAILHTADRVPKLGSVEQGTSALDQDPEAKARQSSVRASLGFCDWEGHRIDLVDTPGSANFIGGAVAAARVIDGAVMVGDYDGYLHWLRETDGAFVARHRIDRAPVRVAPVIDGSTAYVLSTAGELAAITVGAKSP